MENLNFIYNENLWTVGHFIMWLVIGRLFLKNWFIFIFLSVGWEIIEYLIPYDIAKESWGNKISDLITNTIGFYIGNKLRNYNFTSKNNK